MLLNHGLSYRLEKKDKIRNAGVEEKEDKVNNKENY